MVYLLSILPNSFKSTQQYVAWKHKHDMKYYVVKNAWQMCQNTRWVLPFYGK